MRKKRHRRWLSLVLGTSLILQWCSMLVVHHWSFPITDNRRLLLKSLQQQDTTPTDSHSTDSPPHEASSAPFNLYYNLSCPLELSMFSAAHMGYLDRAEKARQLAFNLMHKQAGSQPSSRRVFFVGDSLLRQVFISHVCLSHDAMMDDYAVAWYHSKRSRTQAKHSFDTGPHSKFDMARVRFRTGGEAFYHFGTGQVLELGQDYHSQEPHRWLPAVAMGLPLQTRVLKLGERSEHDANYETLLLTPHDVVLFNGSVHGKRDLNLQTIALLQTYIQPANAHMYPSMAYVVTSPSHFPTENRQFDPSLLHTQELHCHTTTNNHDLQEQEHQLLADKLPFLGLDTLELQYTSGDLHVGGKDCLHWIQPGIPDLVAYQIRHFLTTALPDTTGRTTMVRTAMVR